MLMSSVLVSFLDPDSPEAFVAAADLAFDLRGRVLLTGESLSAWAAFVCLASPYLLLQILAQSEHLMTIPSLKLADGVHFPFLMCRVSALEHVWGFLHEGQKR